MAGAGCWVVGGGGSLFFFVGSKMDQNDIEFDEGAQSVRFMNQE